MQIDTTLVAALVALLVSVVALWSNPSRGMNRGFISLSINVFLWLMALRQSFRFQEGLQWLRLASALGVGIVLHLNWLMELARNPTATTRQRLRKLAPWIVGAVLLAAISFSSAFIPPESTAEHRIYGFGYYLYIAGVLTGYITLIVLALRSLDRCAGVQRIELQLLLLGGGAVAISSLALIALSALLGTPEFVRLVPLTVIIFYSGTVWLMTTTKLFDARLVLRIVGHRLSLVAVVAAGGWLLLQGLLSFVPYGLALFFTVLLGLFAAEYLSPRLEELFDLRLTANRDVRRAAYEAARRSVRMDQLEVAFVEVLKSWAGADHAAVLFGNEERFSSNSLNISKGSDCGRSLEELKWVTPERLSRERSTPDRDKLAAFLHEHHLGAVAFSGSGALAVFVAVGVRATRRPYTYPEVLQLLELASIFENAFARTHFSAKAQHAEQLATVGLLGASIAHEIRNPLVSIKALAQLLPQHHADPKFREKFFRLIRTEVDRIDRLTIQLLDMAQPRDFLGKMISLHDVITGAVELVETKAREKDVRVIAELQAEPDLIFSDVNAVKQVMLNLCFNALQAAENEPERRWIRISTRRLPDAVEMIVSDSGPGIADELRPRLFQPFQSTKSSGFGLGLAICRDILSSLHASIAVEPKQPNEGATFRVKFPCQPPTS